MVVKAGKMPANMSTGVFSMLTAFTCRYWQILQNTNKHQKIGFTTLELKQKCYPQYLYIVNLNNTAFAVKVLGTGLDVLFNNRTEVFQKGHPFFMVNSSSAMV